MHYLLVLCAMAAHALSEEIIASGRPRYGHLVVTHQSGELGARTFANVTNLTAIEIRISSIDAVDARAFAAQPLVMLIIRDNPKFPTIRDATFAHARALKMLRVIKNPNTAIEAGAFRSLAHLDVLLVEHQDVATLTRDFFRGLGRLTQLAMNHDRVERIERDAFADLVALETLYLAHNRLRTIASGTFGALRNVRELQLQGNRLGAVDWRRFDRVPAVEVLNVADNAMTFLEVRDLLVAFANLRALNYLPNNFTCSNEMYIAKKLVAYRITREFYGKDASACARADFRELGVVVFSEP